MNTLCVYRTLRVQNRLGMHLRASAQFVRLACLFPCELRVIHNGRTLNGKSIIEMIGMAAGMGAVLTLEAEGEGAEACVQRLASLIEARFGEAE